MGNTSKTHNISSGRREEDYVWCSEENSYKYVVKEDYDYKMNVCVSKCLVDMNE